MKLVGILTTFGTALVSLLFLMLPTSFLYLGTTVGCGPSVLRLLAPSDEQGMERDLAQQCDSQALGRILVGGAVFLVGVPTGIGMWASGANAARRRRPGAWWWNGQQWVYRG